MPDLTNLNSIHGEDLTEPQLKGILAQIDLDITNLLRDGKLSALKYSLATQPGQTTDRAANLQALLAARKHYEQLLHNLPIWEPSQADCDH
jgi:hypothetical protein